MKFNGLTDKEVEGCSSRTIAYYESTLKPYEAWMEEKTMLSEDGRIVRVDNPWCSFYIDTELAPALDESRCGKWMFYFNDIEFAEEVCRKKNGLGTDIAVFPLQGRFDLKRLPLPYRLIMKVKIKDIAKRLNAKAAKTTLTPAEQACLTMATVGRGEPATWDGIQAAIDWVEANSFHSKFPEPKVC